MGLFGMTAMICSRDYYAMAFAWWWEFTDWYDWSERRPEFYACLN